MTTRSTSSTSSRRSRRGGRPDVATKSDRLAALYAVADETRKLFHRLRAVAVEIHRQGELSGGRRGVLLDLDRLGPQTVPQMARARPVSRQHIQTIVNDLIEEGHVELVVNPAHKRSHLVRLTRKGKELVDAMNRREAKILTGMKIGIPEKDLQAAAAVLRAVRELLECEQWKRLARTVR